MKGTNYTFLLCVSSALTMLLSCQTPQKLYEKGNYDQAIQLAVERLRQRKVKESDISTLAEAFNYIQARDAEQLRGLQADSKNNHSEAIFNLATKIDKRQTLVKPLLMLNDQKYYGKLASLQFIEVSQTIADARTGAADFYYNKGVQNLDIAKTSQRTVARTAYDAFEKTKFYIENYKDVTVLQNEAYKLGINHIYFSVSNESRMLLPSDFEAALKDVFVRDLNERWIKYHTSKDKNLRYEYSIVAKISDIQLSPEQEFRNHSVHKAQVEDGFEPHNPRDTSHIKVPRYKSVHADLFELHQTKKIRVLGSLEYFDNRTSERVLSRPLESNAHFDNYVVEFQGDRRALPNNICQRLGGTRLPFPSDGDLLLNAAENMKAMAKQIVKDNDYIVSR
jgi:hypothetical protein